MKPRSLLKGDMADGSMVEGLDRHVALAMLPNQHRGGRSSQA